MSKGKVVDLFAAESVNPAALQRAHWRTTDIANAELFIERHGAELRYAHNGGGWHQWAEGRWRRDVTESTCALAQATIAAWWREVGTAGSPEERALLAKHVLSSGRAPRLQAMLKLAAANERVALPADAFDRDPFLMTVANGTLDLRTGEIRPHNPADLISKRSPIAYDPTATCARFLEFLNLIFDGDETLVEFVRRAGGYSLTGSVGAQCLFFCWGSGCNGKSTLVDVMHKVAGEYGLVATPALLMMQRHEPHPTEVADLLGARFVSSVETEQDRRLAEVKVKWLTGGDRLKARFMRADFFEFSPTHKFWLLGNHKPVVTGTDPAIWRRIHLVPFNVDLRDRVDLVDDFAGTLADEYPGILAWFVQGAVDWHQDGLRPPAAVQQATAAYRAEMDTVAGWVDEFCERQSRTRTPFKILFDAYTEEFKHYSISKRAFAEELSRLGFQGENTGGMKVRVGLRLRSDPCAE